MKKQFFFLVSVAVVVVSFSIFYGRGVRIKKVEPD